MIAMVVIYAFTGIIHPTEMMCLIHGVLYYLCVPSAFILLMVYSLCNMNNVTWGTREVKQLALNTDVQQEAMKVGANYTLSTQCNASLRQITFISPQILVGHTPIA